MEFLYENNNNNKQKSSQDTSVFTSIRITSDAHFKTKDKQIFVELFLFVLITEVVLITGYLLMWIYKSSSNFPFNMMKSVL